MSAKIVPFREIGPPQALTLMRELAERPIGLDKHSRKRMRQREVSWPQIRQVIKRGRAVEGPYHDIRGQWICRLEANVAGNTIAVVVRMENEERLKLDTVIVLN
jgi:hypothetical protein